MSLKEIFRPVGCIMCIGTLCFQVVYSQMSGTEMTVNKMTIGINAAITMIALWWYNARNHEKTLEKVVGGK